MGAASLAQPDPVMFSCPCTRQPEQRNEDLKCSPDPSRDVEAQALVSRLPACQPLIFKNGKLGISQCDLGSDSHGFFFSHLGSQMVDRETWQR